MKKTLRSILCLFLAVLMIIAPVQYVAAATSAEMLVANSFTSTSKVYSSSQKKTVTTTYYHNNTLKNYKLFKGLDVSWWQSDENHLNTTIDWTKAHADGIDFAIVRVAARNGSGTLYEDTSAKSHIENALANNINIGVYIYSQALTVAEAKEEAEYVLKILDKQNWDITLPVVFDYEFGTRLKSGALTKTQMTNICKAFCQIIEEAGYQPMIYANYAMCKSHLNTATLAKSYPIWLARYNKTTTSNYLSTGTAVPYADITYPYEFWQFTSSGRVSGYSGNLDCNYWYKNTAIKTENLELVDQTSNTVQLQWSDTGDAKNYRVYRYNPESGSYKMVGDVADTTFTDTSLESGTEYKYKVRCYWMIGGTRYFGSYSDILDVATEPAKITDLGTKSRTSNTLTLGFSAVNGADGYRIYQYDKDSSSYKQIGQVEDGSATSYQVTGLTSCTEYQFRVKAYKAVNETTYWSSYSNTLTTITRPLKVSGLTVSTASTTKTTLNWNKVSRATGYKVYRYDAASDSWKLLKTIEGNSTVSYSDSGLSASGEYQYKVRAYKTYNEETIYGLYSDVTEGTTKPAKVTKLTVKPASSTEMTLTWEEVPGVDGYKVYRYEKSSDSWKLLKTLTDNTTLTYTDTKLSTATEYQYRVRGYKTFHDATVFGLYSDATAGMTKPGKVTDLAGTSTSKKTVTLTWSKVSRATGYKVYRYDSANKKWVLLTTLKGYSNVTYTDTGRTSGKNYKYRVRAYKTYNDSTYYGSYATSVTVKVK